MKERRSMRGRSVRWLVLGLAATALGCTGDRAPELETRTFEVFHIEDYVAEALVEPYVYRSREGAPGMVSVIDGKVTVRETPDNLRRIEEVLAEYDRPKPTVRLNFQVIEANGESEVDPRITEVEEALRQLFRFEGYRLIGEVMVYGTEGNQVYQEFNLPGLGPSAIEAMIRDVRTDSAGGSIQLEMRLNAPSHAVFGTTVRVRAGQTAVLGRTPSSADARNIIVAVKAELDDL